MFWVKIECVIIFHRKLNYNTKEGSWVLITLDPSLFSGYAFFTAPFKMHRSDVIRTRGLHVPNVALYQTEPHPDLSLQQMKLYLRPLFLSRLVVLKKLSGSFLFWIYKYFIRSSLLADNTVVHKDHLV